MAGAAGTAPPVAADGPISFTILHTNDFHGQLVPSGSAPGLARVAGVVNAVRTAKGAGNVLLVDGGDEMQGSLLSNLQKGAPTIAAFNAMGTQVATFGNHEFDWGQSVLNDRTNQAAYPFVTANIVKNDNGNCATAGWTVPDTFKTQPYVIETVAGVKVAFIGVTTQETPTITIASATQGLCFKDPFDSIVHYYDTIKANADVIVVLSHLGFADGGYGYGIPVYGDQTLAQKLIDAGKPVPLIIGGHSHTNMLATPTPNLPTGKVVGGKTTVVQAYYNGRQVGEADMTFDTASKAATVSWHTLLVNAVGALSSAVAAGDTSISVAEATAQTQATPFDITVDDETMTVTSRTAPPAPPATGPATYIVTRLSGVAHAKGAPVTLLPVDQTVKGVISTYANDPAYLALVNTPIGYSAVDLPRNGGAADNMMGDFVDDAIYGYLNTDSDPTNDIDIFFNNAGGIRTDWCYAGGTWSSSGCTGGTHAPGLLTYGNMFTILPFGNATVVGKMTGAQILQVLNQAPLVSNGVIQPTGLKFKYFAYKDKVNAPGTATSPYTYAWGAFDYCVVNKTTHACDPLDMNKTYSVGTNEFLAPGGGDGYGGFKYMTNITYWGDMLNAVDAYVSAHYGTAAKAYKGPNGDGTLDGRIIRDGNDDGGSIIPITVLHNNDSHGNLTKGQYVGMTQLATLIKQEKLHNPGRTILLNGGDQIQGDAMSYYFKDAASGYASDGTALPDGLKMNPMMAVMNSLGYDAMTLGNHEFNFGSQVFKDTLGQAQFPILGANVTDDGRYGLAAADGGQGVKPYIEKNLGGIKVAVLGITNHRVPNYELPSNIQGLTFSNPITTGEQYAPELAAKDDVVIALTHIGFTTNPKSVEVDTNVDTNFAADVPGIDAIVGSHSHTNPAAPEPPYKFLPTIVAGPGGNPVLVSQAYRYNNTLGEEVLGVRVTSDLALSDIQRLFAEKSIDNAGIRDALLEKLNDAVQLYSSGDVKSAADVLKAFINSVEAQTGKHISKSAAATLTADAQRMISHDNGYTVVTRAGQYLSVQMSTGEDSTIKGIVDPYVAALATYQTKELGQTTAPIDTTNAYVAETNAANLQADASVAELAGHGITDVDVHLSGAMTQSNPKVLFGSASPSAPVTLHVSDMFTLMPYENSLVVLSMNGPQLKAVLERAYRNYYYYKYFANADPKYGGYSYYTTCMIDTNSVGRITYDEKKGAAATPPLPDGSNVVSLTINDTPVDFTDAAKFYNVSTVNYLAAGSCNFNDNGVSLWPLNQIVHDTQYYVRDAVIDYITAEKTISPSVEGRVVFK